MKLEDAREGRGGQRTADTKGVERGWGGNDILQTTN